MIVERYVRICWVIIVDLQGIEVRIKFCLTDKALLVALSTMKNVNNDILHLFRSGSFTLSCGYQHDLLLNRWNET
jgi:hypothetical protein